MDEYIKWICTKTLRMHVSHGNKVVFIVDKIYRQVKYVPEDMLILVDEDGDEHLIPVDDKYSWFNYFEKQTPNIQQ